VAHLRSSSKELALSEICKSKSPSTLQGEKLPKDNWYWREIRCNEPTWQGWTNFDICCNIRLAHSNIHMILNNANRPKESAKCLDNIQCQQSQTGSVCLCSKTTTVLSEWTVPKNYECKSLTFLLH